MLKHLPAGLRVANPWVKDGYVDARLLVYRDGFEGPIWVWEIGDWGEVEKPAQIRAALRQAAELWRDSGMASVGDRCELRIGDEVTTLTITADGSLR